MADYYVDSNAADDLGDGSIGNPWRDWWVHVNGLVAGDVLNFRGGGVGAPQLYDSGLNEGTITAGGGPNYLTLQPYGGEYITMRSGNATRVLSLENDYIRINGKDQLEIDKNASSGVHVIRVTNCNYCEILDLEAHNVSGLCNSIIQVNVADYLLIDGCVLHNCFKGNADDSSGIYQFSGTFTEIRNCTIYDCYGDGIQVGDIDASTRDGMSIHDNIWYTTLGECSENALDIKMGGTVANPMLIYNNTIYGFRACTATCGGSGNLRGDGVIIHNSAEYVEFYDNTLYDCTGFITIDDNISNIDIYRNVMYDMKTDVEDPNSSGEVGLYVYADDINIWNNVIEDCPADQPFLGFHPAGCSNVIIRNNIFKDCGTITEEGAAGLTVDHNCWNNTVESIVGVGDETNNPLFTNEAGRDYTLQAASPCIDAGVDVGLPFNGLAPDMGAFETVPPPVIPPVIPPVSDGLGGTMADQILSTSQSIPGTWRFKYADLGSGVYALINGATLVSPTGALSTDEITSALVTIPVVHHEVHEGEMFTVYLVDIALADDATLMIRLLSSTRYPHITFTGACGGNATLELIENPTINAAGAALVEQNNKRTGGDTATVQAFSNPTIANGTVLLNAVLPGGTGGNSSGGLLRPDTEWPGSLNEDYVIRLTNIAGNAQPASLVVNWYEESDN